MPRKSKEAQRRSEAARKGWQTRRRHEREEERRQERERDRRSEAARKGWQTRRQKEREQLLEEVEIIEEEEKRQAIPHTRAPAPPDDRPSYDPADYLEYDDDIGMWEVEDPVTDTGGDI